MSFWSSLTGQDASDAAAAAAQDQYAKQVAAADDIKKAGNQYRQSYDTLSHAYDPYTQAGGSALAQLLGGLGLGGPGSQQAFTDAYRALPGYQNGLDAGSDAVARGLNTTGMLNSGRAMKELTRFGSNYEDQRASDYLSRLMGLGTQGLGATQAQVNTQGQGLNGQLATRQSAYTGMNAAAPTIGQGMVAGANAMQQGSTNLLGAGLQLGGMALGAAGGLGGLGGGGALGSLLGGGTGYLHTPGGFSGAFPKPI